MRHIKLVIFICLLAFGLTDTWREAIAQTVIKQSNPQSRGVVLLMVDPTSSTGAGKTGLTGAAVGTSVAVSAGVAGSFTSLTYTRMYVTGTGAAVVNTNNCSGTITEVGKGNYLYVPTSAEANTTYDTLFIAQATGAIDAESQVAFSTYKMDDIAAALPMASGTGVAPNSPGGLITFGTGAGQVNPNGSGKVPATLLGSDVSGTVGADLQTIKTVGITTPASAVSFGPLLAVGSGAYTPGWYTAPPTTTQIHDVLISTAGGKFAVDSNGNIYVSTGANVGNVTFPGTVINATLPSTYPLAVNDEAALAALYNAFVTPTANPPVLKSATLANAPTGGGGGGPTAATIAAAVWDELVAGHTTTGSFGPLVGSIKTAIGTPTISLVADLQKSLKNLPYKQAVATGVGSNKTQLLTYYPPGTDPSTPGNTPALYTATIHFNSDGTINYVTYN